VAFSPGNSGFLASKAARILTVVLILQATLLYGVSRREIPPQHRELAGVPPQLGSWTQAGEFEIAQDVRDVLKADDLLNRSYVNANFPVSANLFVAYFNSQRTGQAPHSPKNCLPGSGWVPSKSDVVHIDVPGRATPIEANRYVVSLGNAESLVLYWYQSRDRVVASEYTAKFYVIADAIRYNRTDTALVRVVVPMGRGVDLEQAQTAASDFVRASFKPLRQHFPAS
jgi:EpsI family protein